MMSQSSWSLTLIATAGLLGFAGVATGAAGSHAGGGDLARLASTFFLLHAAALCGITALAERMGRSGPLCRAAATILGIGTALFAGDLAVLGLTGTHALRALAPIGGLLLLAGWAVLASAPIWEAFARHWPSKSGR